MLAEDFGRTTRPAALTADRRPRSSSAWSRRGGPRAFGLRSGADARGPNRSPASSGWRRTISISAPSRAARPHRPLVSIRPTGRPMQNRRLTSAKLSTKG